MPILFVATDIDGDVELIVCRPQPEHFGGFRIAFDRVWRIERFHLGRAKDLTRIRLKFSVQSKHVHAKSLLAKYERTVLRVDLDGLAFANFAFKDVDTERVEHFFLNGAAQRTSAVNGIVTFPRQKFLG